MFDANVNPIEPFRPFCESIAAYSFKRYKSDLILSGLLLISIWMKISCCKWPRNVVLRLQLQPTNCCTFDTRASCQSNMSCSYFYNMFLSIARFATGLLCRPTKSKSPGNRRRLRRPEAGTFLGNLGRIYIWGWQSKISKLIYALAISVPCDFAAMGGAAAPILKSMSKTCGLWTQTPRQAIEKVSSLEKLPDRYAAAL